MPSPSVGGDRCVAATVLIMARPRRGAWLAAGAGGMRLWRGPCAVRRVASSAISVVAPLRCCGVSSSCGAWAGGCSPGAPLPCRLRRQPCRVRGGRAAVVKVAAGRRDSRRCVVAPCRRRRDAAASTLSWLVGRGGVPPGRAAASRAAASARWVRSGPAATVRSPGGLVRGEVRARPSVGCAAAALWRGQVRRRGRTASATRANLMKLTLELGKRWCGAPQWVATGASPRPCCLCSAAS